VPDFVYIAHCVIPALEMSDTHLINPNPSTTNKPYSYFPIFSPASCKFALCLNLKVERSVGV
jgi:hypothetical protein